MGASIELLEIISYSVGRLASSCRRKLLAIAVLIAAGTAAPAAETIPFTGNELLKECEQLSHFCDGFLLGMGEVMVNLAKEEYQICIPENTNARQVRDVVMLRLRERPQDRAHPAWFIATVALLDAWPCTKQK